MSTFVTLISEENETRNKNPANFFTLQNFLAGTSVDRSLLAHKILQLMF